MLIYDESFAAVMTATQSEASALGARAFGSEHVLLGLLAADDGLTRRVVHSFPALTSSAARAAVRGAVDDAPHLERLGLTGVSSTVEPPVGCSSTRPVLRTKHTPELQEALNRASAKWGHLRRTHALPKERGVSSAVLWLAVLEPTARARRLLAAMDVDPEGVRTAVLSALVPDGAPVPAWPTQSPAGPVMRLVHRVFGRTNVAR